MLYIQEHQVCVRFMFVLLALFLLLFGARYCPNTNTALLDELLDPVSTVDFTPLMTHIVTTHDHVKMSMYCTGTIIPTCQIVVGSSNQGNFVPRKSLNFCAETVSFCAKYAPDYEITHIYDN